MDFFNSRYYRINKRLLSTVGQWPFQSPNTNRNICIVFALITGTQFAAKISGLIATRDDIDIVLESIAPIMVDLTAGIKLVNGTVNSNQIKVLLKGMQKNYMHLPKGTKEVEILDKYSERGRSFTTLYAGSLFTAMILFMVMPILPQLLDKGENATEKQLIHNVEYFVDPQAYYYPILLHAYAMIIICITAIVASDCIFVVFVQHTCGLFALVGHRLGAVEYDKNDEFIFRPKISDDKAYQGLLNTVRSHQTAIEFANIVEDAYSHSFFVQTGMSILALSFTGVLTLMNLNEPQELVRQVAFQAALLVHTYFESLQGQHLIDHCTRLQEDLICTNWYTSSLRSRQILGIMITRAQRPSVLTAAGMFTRSMDSFSTIVKTSTSYFTMLRTMQVED